METSEVLPYESLVFPEAPVERPYVSINMVSTIDGKILTGERNEAVMDLGSKNDHAVMRRIEEASDAVIIGAGSLRATKGIWYPPELIRVVVSQSGRLPWESRFFTDRPDKAFVCTDSQVELPGGVRRLPGNLRECLREMRIDHGVRRLLCEGGSELNASMIHEDLVDELFLTLAPKIKLGRDVPTYADGIALERADVKRYALVELNRVGDEVFLRYRRPTPA
jgi:riboflavin biosynthesis pyrimidine reductase